jgi:hypothetical protein
MIRKKRIVIIIGVGAVLIAAVALGLRAVNRGMDRMVTDVVAAAPTAADMFKGALGRRLLEGGEGQGPSLDPGTINAQLQNVPGPDFSRTHQSFIDEYQKDPQKFHRYAQVLDTWLTAVNIADASSSPGTGTRAVSSSSLRGIIPQEKLDAWGHAFCVIRAADRTVLISGGPDVSETISCQRIRMSPADVHAITPPSIKQRPDGSLVLAFSRPTVLVK